MSGRFSDTPGLPPLATATQHGLLSAADYARLAAMTGTFTAADDTFLTALITNLGAADESIPGGNVSVSATTVTQIAGTVTLAAGIWLLWGWSNILMGAGAGTADIYLRQSTTQLAGSLATFALAAGAQAGGPTPIVRVTPVSSTAYNLACFSSAACTARVTSAGAGGFNNGLGIRAVRLQ